MNTDKNGADDGEPRRTQSTFNKACRIALFVAVLLGGSFVTFLPTIGDPVFYASLIVMVLCLPFVGWGRRP